jgi:hypothetical protein
VLALLDSRRLSRWTKMIRFGLHFVQPKSKGLFSATRRPLGRRVKLDGSPTLVGRVKLTILAVISLFGIGLACPAQSQQSASLCLAITTLVNGIATTSCVPVSASTPLPVSVLGTSTATLTAGTTPTSGFTAGQLLMSNGATIAPAGAAVGTSLTLTGVMSALSFTANSLPGVSCAAGILTPATTVVTNGIITHC